MDEEKTITETESEVTTPPKDAGNESKADAEVKRINADTERINKAIAENENAKARQKLGGVSEAGEASQTPEEKEKATAQKGADEIVNAFK